MSQSRRQMNILLVVFLRCIKHDQDIQTYDNSQDNIHHQQQQQLGHSVDLYLAPNHRKNVILQRKILSEKTYAFTPSSNFR